MLSAIDHRVLPGQRNFLTLFWYELDAFVICHNLQWLITNSHQPKKQQQQYLAINNPKTFMQTRLKITERLVIYHMEKKTFLSAIFLMWQFQLCLQNKPTMKNIPINISLLIFQSFKFISFDFRLNFIFYLFDDQLFVKIIL